jgi:hypothetical protein
MADTVKENIAGLKDGTLGVWERHSGMEPPPAQPNWSHSEQVLVYYEGNPEAQVTDKFGIAYYHYDQPFNGAKWLDFNNYGRRPKYWWTLPTIA